MQCPSTEWQVLEESFFQVQLEWLYVLIDQASN